MLYDKRNPPSGPKARQNAKRTLGPCLYRENLNPGSMNPMPRRIEARSAWKLGFAMPTANIEARVSVEARIRLQPREGLLFVLYRIACDCQIFLSRPKLA